jgi:hypothetical protein
MASYANRKRRDLSFVVGEWVFLKLRPHRQQSLVKRISQKMSVRFYGPFQIAEKIGAVAYRLKLPSDSKIHPVFHVSLLKKAVGNYHVQGELPKELEIDTTEDVYPEQVLATRVIRQGDREVHQSLIKWKHKTMDDVTWEDNDILMGQFPEFGLEDKASFREEGIDRNENADVGLNDNETRPRVWKVYTRKRTKEVRGGDVAI